MENKVSARLTMQSKPSTRDFLVKLASVNKSGRINGRFGHGVFVARSV